MKVLFAGGCHLEGYPIGSSLSFPGLIAEEISGCEIKLLHYQNLRSGSNIYQECRSWQPDKLVLQLGHYEIPYEVRKVLKPAFIKRREQRSHHLKSWVVNPRLKFQPDTFWRMKALARRALPALMTVLNHPLYEKKSVSRLLGGILSRLPDSLRSSTYVLSPFPCADPFMRACRLDSWEIFAEKSLQFGCHFIDTQSELLDHEAAGSGLDLYADPYHLSAEGHKVIAHLLSMHLSAPVEGEVSTV
jgi:hypothetical protein